MKNLKHLTNINDAAHELHKMLVNNDWYITIQVMAKAKVKSQVSDKRDYREIVVFVKTNEAIRPDFTFNSWPVRYELGIAR